MGFRALAQVLLGVFAFAVFVLLLTANSDQHGTLWTEIGGVTVGAPTLFLALLVALLALVVVSRWGRSQKTIGPRDPASGTAIRSECSECDWKGWAPTIEDAKDMGRQHLDEAHGGPVVAPEG